MEVLVILPAVAKRTPAVLLPDPPSAGVAKLDHFHRRCIVFMGDSLPNQEDGETILERLAAEAAGSLRSGGRELAGTRAFSLLL